jgi:hypothetical protein
MSGIYGQPRNSTIIGISILGSFEVIGCSLQTKTEYRSGLYDRDQRKLADR